MGKDGFEHIIRSERAILCIEIVQLELQCASLQKFSPKVQAAATCVREWAVMATLKAAVDDCHFQDSAAKSVQMKATYGWQQIFL